MALDPTSPRGWFVIGMLPPGTLPAFGLGWLEFISLHVKTAERLPRLNQTLFYEAQRSDEPLSAIGFIPFPCVTPPVALMSEPR